MIINFHQAQYKITYRLLLLLHASPFPALKSLWPCVHCVFWHKAHGGLAWIRSLEGNSDWFGRGVFWKIQFHSEWETRKGHGTCACMCSALAIRVKLCSALAIGVKLKVARLCPTFCDPMDYRVHGILQARVLEWIAFPFSRGSSQPRDQTQVFCIAGGFFTSWATKEVQKFWSG